MVKHIVTLISEFWVSKFVQYYLEDICPKVPSCWRSVIFAYKHWVLSLDMKTKVVEHVPRINISIWHLTGSLGLSDIQKI